MEVAIENLYATFAHYRVGNDFTGCDCCVGPEHSAALAKPPLRDLTYDDLDRYSQKAISTWGNTRHFKHFLPRLLELTVEHRDDFLDLAVVFGKLAYAQWHSWPQREQNAVNQFFDAYWRHQLANPVVGAFADALDTVLCALSNACASVQPYLDVWLQADTENARLHLAAFILNNDSSLLKKGRLSNAFWDTAGTPHREVLYWLQSQAVLNYLTNTNANVLVDDFAYAVPQLHAIRAAFASVSP